MTSWKIVHGSAKPQEIDTTSSATTVYEHRNITQETIENEMDNEPITQWVYEERQMTKEEYRSLSSAVTQMMMQSISDLEADILELLV